MTVTPTYPGVYIREIPSGSRTITGVATSITAFIGTARRGPVDEPVPIAGFGDFERAFGGLWRDSGLGYAVRDFFTNGGSSALVDPSGARGRTIRTPPPTSGPSGRRSGWPPALPRTSSWRRPGRVPGPAASRSTSRTPTGNDADDIAAAQGVAAGDLFNLVVRDGSGDEAPTESYLNVTSGAGPRPVDLVLAGSALVQVSGALPAARPRDGSYALFGLDVGGLPLVTKDITRWAGITAVITHHVTDSGGPADTAATVQGVAVDQLFTLVLKTPATEERYELVTVADGDGGRWKQPDRPRHGRLGVGADRATSGEPTGRRHLRGGHRHRRRRPAPRRDGRHPVGQRDHGRSLPSSGPGPGHHSRCQCTGRDPGRFVHPRPEHAGHGGAVPAGDGGQRNAGRCEQPDRPRDGQLAVGARRHRLASDRPPGARAPPSPRTSRTVCSASTGTSRERATTSDPRSSRPACKRCSRRICSTSCASRRPTLGQTCRRLGVGRGRWLLHAAAGLPPRRPARRRPDDDRPGSSPPPR